ncbi:MAG: alpha/beta fold hydrolase [Paracoccaceae bacterium]
MKTSKQDEKRQVLFIQGGGASVHSEWDSKLVASLRRHLGSGHVVLYPRMPNEDNPEFASWGEAIAREVPGLNDGAILVGHSIGGTILVHTVTRQPRLLGGIAAVCLIAAPFVGDGGWRSDEFTPASDWAAPLSQTDVCLYQGDADETTPMTHLDLYTKAIPHARVRVLVGRDHQLNNDLHEVADDIRSAQTSSSPASA